MTGQSLPAEPHVCCYLHMKRLQENKGTSCSCRTNRDCRKAARVLKQLGRTPFIMQVHLFVCNLQYASAPRDTRHRVARVALCSYPSVLKEGT